MPGAFKDKKLASAAGKKSSNKGKKHKLTQLQELMAVSDGAILDQINKNIEELINSDDKNIRLDATKAFCNYYKPRKLEHSGTFTGNINITFKY